MDKMEYLQKMRAARFIENNGRVLQMLNLLRIKYIKLGEAQYAMAEDISENEFLDSVNYLLECEYIKLRDIRGKQAALLADVDYNLLEAKLTQKGIDLLRGNIVNENVKLRRGD